MFKEILARKQAISNRKTVHGVGINDAVYATNPVINGVKHVCPYYKKWASMINRCYGVKYKKQKPTYDDCFVCEEWLLFSNFKSWMENQEWEGKHLDKDLLKQGNKEYSPYFCLFVTPEINSLFTDRSARRGRLKKGVSWNSRDRKFYATFSFKGKKKHIGCFNSEDEAFDAYVQAKKEYVKEIAEKQTDERLKNALLNYRIEK